MGDEGGEEEAALVDAVVADENAAIAGGGQHDTIDKLLSHSQNHSNHLTDLLLQLVNGEQELRASLEALRKGQGDDLAALRAELQRFRDDTNAELDSMREGQEKLTADMKDLSSGMGEDLQAALAAGSELNSLKTRVGQVESLANAHETVLKRQADQIEADKAAQDVLAGLDRDAFNADIDPDDDDDMENSELFNQIAKRTNAIASSTKNLMAGAMGAPTNPTAMMEGAFSKWRAVVEEQILERKIEAGDVEAKARDAEAKAAKQALEDAARTASEQAEAMVQASVTRKLQDKLMFAKLDQRLNDLAAKQAADSELLGQVEKLKEECEGLERGLRNADAVATSASERADAAERALAPLRDGLTGLQKDIAPLSALPPAVASMSDAMAGKTPMEKFKLLEEEVARLTEKTGDGLPPELQAMLKELGGLSDMQKELQSHAKSLASLFNEKATEADLLGAKNDTRSVDERLSDEIERRAAALQAAMDKARADWEAGLGKLNTQIADRPDANWLSEFEQQIRDEMARLRASGESTVTKEELEEQLRRLRARLASLSGQPGDGGSAAFATCLACDRPLPNPDKWKDTPQDYSQSGLPNPRNRATQRTRRPRSSDGRYRTKSIESPQFHRPRSGGGSRVGVTMSGTVAYGGDSSSLDARDYAVASVGGSLEPLGRRDDQPEVVMRGGFPMMNPKIKPHERSEDHSRLFGRNDLGGHHTRSANAVM